MKDGKKEEEGGGMYHHATWSGLLASSVLTFLESFLQSGCCVSIQLPEWIPAHAKIGETKDKLCNL
jgi:hypothetical protein